jgi:hypothetical protein
MMVSGNKKTFLVVLVALIIGVAFGRYATPERVRIEIEKVEVERVVEVEKRIMVKEEVKKTSIKRNTQTEKITKPDGTVIEKTSESEEDVTFADNREKEGSEKGTDRTTTSSETKKTDTKYNTKKVSVSVMAGVKDADSSFEKRYSDYLMYGVHAAYRFAGPFSVGAFATTTNEFGLSIGMDF